MCQSCLHCIRNDVVIARQPNEPDNIIGKRVTAVVSEFAAVWQYVRTLHTEHSFWCRLERRLLAGTEPDCG